MFVLLWYYFFGLSSQPVTPAEITLQLKQRLQRLFPQSWITGRALDISQNAQSNGILGAIFYGLAAGLSVADQALSYVKAQTRMATVTDGQVDLASRDFFLLMWPRLPNETDRAFALRIVNRLLWGPNLAGIQAAVTWYFNSLLVAYGVGGAIGLDSSGSLDTSGSLDDAVVPSSAAPSQLLGLDTSGSLDNWGALDRAIAQGGTPTLVVFDCQSNPAWAAAVGLVATQAPFCVYFRFPGYPDTAIHAVSAPIPMLDALLQEIKAEGTLVTYAQNY